MDLDLQLAYKHESIPEANTFERWIKTSLDFCSKKHDVELTIRIVDEKEISQLNQKYRNKNKSTNVLSFCSKLPDDIPINLLGDVIICPQVLVKEAQQQEKSLDAHWCHLTVHGILHLLGFDHQEESEADIMETKEINILKALGFNNPYT